MHELSIAQNIVEMISQAVPEHRLHQVRRVHAVIGEQSGVMADSLLFSYQAITASSPLHQSLLIVQRVAFVVECCDCQKKTETGYGTKICPLCGSDNTIILSGTEMQLRDIELDEEMEKHS